MQSEKCPKCGSRLEFRREGSVQGFYCVNCDWAVVTTHIPKIDLDETKYRVWLLARDCSDEARVRKLPRQFKPSVLEALAPKVIEARETLKAVGLQVEISPTFPY
jgi:uncharacterized Zn finger protein (UPF0148 family)